MAGKCRAALLTREREVRTVAVDDPRELDSDAAPAVRCRHRVVGVTGAWRQRFEGDVLVGDEWQHVHIDAVGRALDTAGRTAGAEVEQHLVVLPGTVWAQDVAAS